MHENHANSQEIVKLLHQNSEWSDIFDDSVDFFSLQKLKDYLQNIILEWLNNNPERLVQAMYQIDVKENDFLEALKKGDSELMATLVIERQLQKIYFREKYKEN